MKNEEPSLFHVNDSLIHCHRLLTSLGNWRYDSMVNMTASKVATFTVPSIFPDSLVWYDINNIEKILNNQDNHVAKIHELCLPEYRWRYDVYKPLYRCYSTTPLSRIIKK